MLTSPDGRIRALETARRGALRTPGATEPVAPVRLTTEAPDAATGRVRFVPTTNAGSGEVMGFHRHLLADRVRTGAFVEAVRRTVRPLDFVVDLGTGTGVLAVAAAQAGAGAVIGIERTAVASRARALAAANNARVTVVQGASDEVRLPRLVDVLVSECLGLAGLGGAMIGAVKRARDRWLKPGGIVIPTRVRVFAAAVEDPEADALVHCWDGARVADVRLDVLGAHVGHNLYIASFTHRHLLGPPVEVCGTDLLAGPLEDAVTGTAMTTTARRGTLHGWALWFEADLADDLVLRTGPLDAPTVWEQCFAPVPARRVEADTPIDLTLRFRGRHTGLDYQPSDTEGCGSTGTPPSTAESTTAAPSSVTEPPRRRHDIPPSAPTVHRRTPRPDRAPSPCRFPSPRGLRTPCWPPGPAGPRPRARAPVSPESCSCSECRRRLPKGSMQTG